MTFSFSKHSVSYEDEYILRSPSVINSRTALRASASGVTASSCLACYVHHNAGGLGEQSLGGPLVLRLTDELHHPVGLIYVRLT